MRGPTCDGVLRLVTNRLDLPAELIAEIYRLRWVIEMFFRTFKQLLGCKHLFSDKHNGVEIQASFAMIVCMLILIYTGENSARAAHALERAMGASAARMAKRSGHAASRGLEGRDERPARGRG